MSTMQQGGEYRASDRTKTKPTATTTKTVRFHSLCKSPVEQGLDNHGTSHRERQTDGAEQEM
jgi:hypothetical protein